MYRTLTYISNISSKSKSKPPSSSASGSAKNVVNEIFFVVNAADGANDITLESAPNEKRLIITEAFIVLILYVAVVVVVVVVAADCNVVLGLLSCTMVDRLKAGR